MNKEAKFQSSLNLGILILTFIGLVTGGVLWFAKKFSDMDTRMQKIESAIKVMNVAQTDERQKELIKELMAEVNQEKSKNSTADAYQAGKSYLKSPGVSASAPAQAKPPER